MSSEVRANLALALILTAVRGGTSLAALHGVQGVDEAVQATSIQEALDLLGFDTAEQAIDGLLAQVAPRDALILERRLLRLNNLANQETLGREIGLTRQRVQQLEGPVKARWWAAVEADESLQLYSRAWRLALPPAIPLDELAAGYADHQEAVVVTLTRLTDRSVEGGWSVASSWLSKWETFSKQLATAADEQLYVERHELSAWAEGFDLAIGKLLRRAADFGAEEFLGGVLFRPTRRSRALTALRLSDQPLTVEEVAKLAGASDNYISNILAESDEVVRADKQRWWMRDRVADPYEGIVQEVRQRIDAGGGIASVELLLRDLPATFGVAESSVRSYVYGKLFTVDGDSVRKCSDYRFEPKDPRLLKNVRRTEHGWAERVLVKAEHLRGYSVALSPHVCFANGVRPSDSLRVPIQFTQDEASIIWNTSNTTGRVDVGRLRSTLLARGIAARTVIWIVATPRTVTVLETDGAADSVEATDQQTSLEDLTQLVGVEFDDLPANPLLARLRARRT